MIGEDFEEDVKLNRFKLDEEAQKNPSLVQFYGEQLAEAKTIRDKAYNAVKLIEAQKELDYRANPPDGIKITESVISALVEADKDVIKIKEAEQKAKEKVYFIESAVSALDDRRSEIKNLTQLWIAGYYSVPGVSQDNGGAMEMRRKLLKEND